MDRTQVYKDKSGEWRWRRKSENGQVVSESGEGYKNLDFAMRMARELNEGTLIARVADDDEDEAGTDRESAPEADG
jgi:hypothetical protein